MGPIFILGYPHSALGAMATGIASLRRFGTAKSEGHVFAVLAPCLSRIVRGEVSEASWLRTPEGSEAILRGVSRSLNRFLSPTQNVKDATWIDQTPDLAQIEALPVIETLYPDARYVFLYRAPEEAIGLRLQSHPELVLGREGAAAERWCACQRRWRAHRAKVAGRACEIFAPQMHHAPQSVAETLKPILDLSDEEVDTLAQFWPKGANNEPAAGDADDTGADNGAEDAGADAGAGRFDVDEGVIAARTLGEDGLNAIGRVTAMEVVHWPLIVAARAKENEQNG